MAAKDGFYNADGSENSNDFPQNNNQKNYNNPYGSQYQQPNETLRQEELTQIKAKQYELQQQMRFVEPNSQQCVIIQNELNRLNARQFELEQQFNPFSQNSQAFNNSKMEFSQGASQFQPRPDNNGSFASAGQSEVQNNTPSNYDPANDVRADLEYNKHYKFKICLIGDGGTGKTTYMTRVFNGNFVPKYEATVGAVVREVKYSIPDYNSTVTFEIWDTAGQERNYGLKEGYYFQAHAGFFFFDVSSRYSLSNIPNHIKSFKAGAGFANPVIYIIGSKADLTFSKSVFSAAAKFKKLCSEIIYISAKSNHQFSLPLDLLIKQLFKNQKDLVLFPIIDSEQLNEEDYMKNTDNNQSSYMSDIMANFVPNADDTKQ